MSLIKFELGLKNKTIIHHTTIINVTAVSFSVFSESTLYLKIHFSDPSTNFVVFWHLHEKFELKDPSTMSMLSTE